MAFFVLVDCNNFYVSCERAFNPRLENQPIVILSNNDGCIISRSNEAKKLGIPMGAAFHQWKSFCHGHGVHVFSSNYELYGDMSHRIMTLLQKFCTTMEIYSIDEAFLFFDKMNSVDLNTYLLNVRYQLKKCTGLPTSIGFAQTKTLAKVANLIAKKRTVEGVYNFSDPMCQDQVLEKLSVQEVWGVGHRLARKLESLNITTAKILRDSDTKQLRDSFSIVLERTITELRGTSCLPLVEYQQPKQIISSRSFGKKVTALVDLEEAISHYAAKAAHKLRKQNCFAQGVLVFLNTNIFRPQDPQYENHARFRFPYPTADTGEIVKYAKACLGTIYRMGFTYHKAGMMLLDLTPNTFEQFDMVLDGHAQTHAKSIEIMKVVDSINQCMGKNTLFFCAEGIKRAWQIKCDRRTPCYTTRWSDLAIAYC
ncbi:MAG: Y-family DNA polymerase [Gammaproteobacteria bacterium]|nr:Y-family DNA polymerase [Gammaproteobacteria bacterium]